MIKTHKNRFLVSGTNVTLRVRGALHWRTAELVHIAKAGEGQVIFEWAAVRPHGSHFLIIFSYECGVGGKNRQALKREESPHMLVLQVEDDANTAQAVELMLKSEGHECETASLGEEAVRLARENDYDLILLDIMLPDIDGYDVLRRMRENNVSAPVLIQSGLVTNERDRAGFGVSESLLKPFNKRELNAGIEAVTNAANARTEGDAATDGESSERRRATRTKTIKGAEIVYNNNNCVMDCVVVSLSDGGAAIQPQDALILPEHFTIKIKFGPTRDCEVCWQHGNKIGVRFLGV